MFSGYTAEQFADHNMNAWTWDTHAPKGFAYNWVHPPLGDLTISLPIRLLGKSTLSRRIVPVIAGVLITFMVFQLGQVLFPENAAIALLGAAFFSLDGLGLTLSRFSLVDTLITLFILTSTFFTFKKKYHWSALFLGMACSVKWTALYLIFLFFLLVIAQCSWKKEKINSNILFLLKTGVLYFCISTAI